MNIPATLQAGDSAAWTDEEWTDAQGTRFYAPAFGMTYEIRGPSTLTLTGTTSGTGWAFTITTTQSGGLTPGKYIFAAYQTATGIRVTRELGNLEITPNIATQVAGYDGRSDAEIALDACQTAIATGSRVVEYMVGDRQTRLTSTREILEAITYWENVVAREQHASAMLSGLNKGKYFVRFMGS